MSRHLAPRTSHEQPGQAHYNTGGPLRQEEETKMCNSETTKNAISRPVWSNAIRGHRAEVWFHRAASAWDLAARLNPEVTEESNAAAAKLLDQIQRYSLADAREWEAENSSEHYCNCLTHKKRQAMLDRRREKLQKALSPYRCKLVNYGPYPSIVDTKTKETLNFLHYFD